MSIFLDPISIAFFLYRQSLDWFLFWSRLTLICSLYFFGQTKDNDLGYLYLYYYLFRKSYKLADTFRVASWWFFQRNNWNYVYAYKVFFYYYFLYWVNSLRLYAIDGYYVFWSLLWYATWIGVFVYTRWNRFWKQYYYAIHPDVGIRWEQTGSTFFWTTLNKFLKQIFLGDPDRNVFFFSYYKQRKFKDWDDIGTDLELGVWKTRMKKDRDVEALDDTTWESIFPLAAAAKGKWELWNEGEYWLGRKGFFLPFDRVFPWDKSRGILNKRGFLFTDLRLSLYIFEKVLF